MVKLFSVRELLARIRALLRRSSTRTRKVVRFGDVEVDLERRIILRQGAEVKPMRRVICLRFTVSAIAS